METARFADLIWLHALFYPGRLSSVCESSFAGRNPPPIPCQKAVRQGNIQKSKWIVTALMTKTTYAAQGEQFLKRDLRRSLPQFFAASRAGTD
jgi:hypothetical protein